MCDFRTVIPITHVNRISILYSMHHLRDWFYPNSLYRALTQFISNYSTFMDAYDKRTWKQSNKLYLHSHDNVTQCDSYKLAHSSNVSIVFIFCFYSIHSFIIITSFQCSSERFNKLVLTMRNAIEFITSCLSQIHNSLLIHCYLHCHCQ